MKLKDKKVWTQKLWMIIVMNRKWFEEDVLYQFENVNWKIKWDYRPEHWLLPWAVIFDRVYYFFFLYNFCSIRKCK